MKQLGWKFASNVHSARLLEKTAGQTNITDYTEIHVTHMYQNPSKMLFCCSGWSHNDWDIQWHPLFCASFGTNRYSVSGLLSFSGSHPLSIESSNTLCNSRVHSEPVIKIEVVHFNIYKLLFVHVNDPHFQLFPSLLSITIVKFLILSIWWQHKCWSVMTQGWFCYLY